jgi:hypothetical protein
MVVKFLKKYNVYNVGEIAGFDNKLAKQLIKSGIAEEYKTKTVEKPPEDKMMKNTDTKKK